MLHIKCLVLDHDDTVVDSTASIHYPAHVEVLRQLRPEQAPISLDGWFMKNFHPGIMEYLTVELGFDEEEVQKEYRIWREFTTSRVPHFFPGIIEALIQYRKRGGLVAVVSHSEKDLIERDYHSIDGAEPLVPDIIFGWDYDSERRKPNPYPVREIMKAFNLKARDLLIVDDLRPGVLMAQASGIPIAAAGWAHNIPQIRKYMREHCDMFFDRVEDFARYIVS
jgi:phosphoglycolate phosphatase/pyrophosphatase PpaX